MLREGYRSCARLTRRHGTTYYWGALLLPAAVRHHVHAVYALCRLADDIVDVDPGPHPGRRLDVFEERVHRGLAKGGAGRLPADPTLAAIVTSLLENRIGRPELDRFFGAMRRDLSVTGYRSWADLLGYMDGSAAVVGEMMLPVLGPLDLAAARPAARSLGLAFQLTNFLRDVAEDLDRGRIYLPAEELARFGADPRLRRVTPQWRALMAFQIDRNRELYARAGPGIRMLPPDAARCVSTARVLYARILERIEQADYDVFAGRVRVPTWQKAALAAGSRFRRPERW